MPDRLPKGKDVRAFAQANAFIDPHDRTAIANALRVAAEQYRKDASGFSAAGILRSAEAFAAQADRAEELAELIEL